MHRQRKRDLNLKPNRVLDKRSSRGMIYENEELRLRTLAIADDVDRGQTDIKKLRKENEHLKREIWSLRDECEKLEEILKKVVASGGRAIDPADLPYPELFLDRRDSYGDDASTIYDDDDHNLTLRNMFMMEDEGAETGSVIEQPLTRRGNTEGSPTSSEVQSSPEITDSNSAPKFGAFHHWGHPTGLEAVREETESIATTSFPLSDSPSSDQLPDPNAVLYNDQGQGFTEFEELEVNPNNNALTAQDNPLIQITPASSPSSIPATESQAHSPLTPGGSSPEGIQDGGCVTVVPKMFQVTSQIHVDNSTEDVVTPGVRVEIQPEISDAAAGSSTLTSLPPASPSTSSIKANKKSQTLLRKKETKAFRHSASVDQPSTLIDSNNVKVRGQCLSRKVNLSTYHTSSSQMMPQMCCHRNFHSYYQSEPSLSAYHRGQTDSSVFDPTLISYPYLGSNFGWNFMENNLVVGYFEGEEEGVKSIRVEDVIDELEAKFDPELGKVKGIRMLPPRVFISFKDPKSVQDVLKEFGDFKEPGGKEFRVKGKHKLIFSDGSQRCWEVSVSGVPAEISDCAVISALNKYGQVVGGLQRRNYKGVDISERVARMHLVKSVPPELTIEGYEVRVVTTGPPGGAPGPLPIERCQDGFTHHHNNSVCGDNLVTSANPHVSVNKRTSVVTSPIPPPLNVISSCHTSTLTTSQTQPPQQEGLKAHKPVIRSTSSNPRLESGPTPASPILVTKRQSSMCTANLSPEDHPSKLLSPTVSVATPAASNNLKVHGNGSTNSAPNLLPVNSKKPLSRLLRSSPGSLIPPSSKTTTTVLAASSSIEASQPQESSAGGGGLRAAFYRSLSIDPRRGSMASQAGENNNIEKVTGAYSRRGSTNLFQGRYGAQGHQPLSQMNSNSSSQFDRRDSVGVRRYGNGVGSGSASGSKEPLPWCGCWGNGCI